jgi:hypothetical protein
VRAGVDRWSRVVGKTSVRAQADDRDVDAVVALRYSVRGLLCPAGPVRCGGARRVRDVNRLRMLTNRCVGVLRNLRSDDRGLDSGPRGDRAAVRARSGARNHRSRQRAWRGSTTWCAPCHGAGCRDRTRSGRIRPPRHCASTVFCATSPHDAQSVRNDHVASDPHTIRVGRRAEPN